MRRRAIGAQMIILALVLLAGCGRDSGGDRGAEELALEIRTEYIGMTALSAGMEVTADYGERVYTYGMALAWDQAEGTTLLYMADHFDLTTGEVLTFDDLFTDPDAAASIALQEALRQAAQGDANGTTYDTALAESLFNRENFYLTADAVVFFYQPQDLAPNAAGAPTFPVDRSLFGDLLADWA